MFRRTPHRAPEGGKSRFGLKSKIALAVFCLLLLLVRLDNHPITPAQRVAVSYLFSLVGWEAANFFDKWSHLLVAALPGGDPTREERLAILDDYLQVTRRASKEEARIERPYLGGSTAAGGAERRQALSRDYLDELLAEKRRLRPVAEETMEAELSAVLLDEGFGSRFDWIFPPVDIAFQQPPTLLVVSRRDRFQLVDAVLLHPDIPGFERGVIERELLDKHNLSSLVDNLAGLSTYPTLVSDFGQLRSVCRTAAHEWLHAFLFIRPLGQNFRGSEEMFTLNETVADIAGRELGDLAFERMGGDLAESASRYVSVEEAYPFFTQTLRETRARAGELLDEGKVEEAEEYMKQQWWKLRLHGFGIRKLNQAFFAFRGRYAEGPASISPIGEQVRQARAKYADAVSFINAVSGVSRYSEFLELLEELGIDPNVGSVEATPAG